MTDSPILAVLVPVMLLLATLGIETEPVAGWIRRQEGHARGRHGQSVPRQTAMHISAPRPRPDFVGAR